LFIYFSGYGFQQNGQIFLLPSDAQIGNADPSSPKDLVLASETAINVSGMIERIQKVGISQVVLIFDTSFVNPNSSTDANNLLAEEIYKQKFSLNNTEGKALAIIHSSGIGFHGYENAEKNQGYFTWEFIEGLKGAAADKNGVVTLKGLLDYTEERVPMRVKLGNGNEQKPWSFVAGYNANEVVITKVATKK
jgi:hypothetical protein